MNTDTKEQDELKTILAEAYQVIGALLETCGMFDSEQGIKIMDNLSQQKLVHTNVLPFTIAVASASPVGDKVVLTAKDRYSELRVDDDESSPLERLRAFCSLAMNGQDWLDVEPFFDAVIHKEQPESNEAELMEALREARGWLHGEGIYRNCVKRIDAALSPYEAKKAKE